MLTICRCGELLFAEGPGGRYSSGDVEMRNWIMTEGGNGSKENEQGENKGQTAGMDIATV